MEDYLDGKLHVFDKDWPELPFAHREHIGCTVDYAAGRNRYMGYLISLGIYSFKGVKVGLDCANGASWNIAKSVFDALGADTYVINNKPNGTNINNNAGSTHIEGLQKFVVEKGLDVGFAYDGDADRCLCVDEKGNVITGDHILYIYGCYMKERGKLLTNTVVTTVMSNFGLYKAFDEQGIGYAKTAVGDKYVYEYMAKNGCRIGGEQSGHIIFSKYASTGDGILTSLKMMEVMLAKKMPMSKLAEPLKIYPQVLENVRVTDKKAAQNDPAVQEAVKAVAEALGDTGRILVRESGTEPLVRVMVEAPDHDTCQKYVDEVVNVVVGYLKEQFVTLEEEYPGVKLIENPYYDTCNNISSLYVAREYIENAFILDGDQIIYNPEILAPEFERSGYNSVWTDDETDEWLQTVENGIVTACSRTGGKGGWQLYSISRWTAEDGKKLKRHLEIEFEQKKNRQIYWDDVAMFCYPEEYQLGIRPMNKDDIIEVDNLSELIALDASYKKYVEEK